jgi:capsular polysaccharide biosynthesis protein
MTDTVDSPKTTQPVAPRPPGHLDPGTPGTSPAASDSLRRGVRAIFRSWWIILICAAVAVAAGIGVQRRQTKTYTATTYVLLGSGSFSQAIAGGFTQTNLQNTADTAASLLTPLREDRAASNAKVPLSSDWSIAVSPSSTSSVMTVLGRTTNPESAARLADAAARQIITANSQTIQTQLAPAVATIRSQETSAPTPGMRRALQGQLNSLAALQSLADRNVTILERALPPGASSVTSEKKVGALALVLGLLVGIAIALFRPERRRPLPPDPAE